MSPLGLVPFRGADYFLIRMTDFGAKNWVFELKTLIKIRYFLKNRPWFCGIQKSSNQILARSCEEYTALPKFLTLWSKPSLIQGQITKVRDFFNKTLKVLWCSLFLPCKVTYTHVFQRKKGIKLRIYFFLLILLNGCDTLLINSIASTKIKIRKKSIYSESVMLSMMNST